MIEVLMSFGPELVLIKIVGHSIHFGNLNYGGQLATIEGLKLDRAGVEKEFEDLKDKDDWRETAIKRFKTKIRSMNSENEIYDYVVKDLKKFGYTPIKKMIGGRRWEKV